MSYCRNNGVDSDVYVIAASNPETGRDCWECVGCTLTEERYGKTVHTRTKMLTHLAHHRSLGHKVPISALERLRREVIEVIDAG